MLYGNLSQKNTEIFLRITAGINKLTAHSTVAVLMLGRRGSHMVTPNDPTLVVSSKPYQSAQASLNLGFSEI